jgi:hypothetical protein
MTSMFEERFNLSNGIRVCRFTEQTRIGQIINFKWRGKILKGKVYESGNGVSNVSVNGKKYFIEKTSNTQWTGRNEL